jgi:hypothetical protein
LWPGWACWCGGCGSGPCGGPAGRVVGRSGARCIRSVGRGHDNASRQQPTTPDWPTRRLWFTRRWSVWTSRARTPGLCGDVAFVQPGAGTGRFSFEGSMVCVAVPTSASCGRRPVRGRLPLLDPRRVVLTDASAPHLRDGGSSRAGRPLIGEIPAGGGHVQGFCRARVDLSGRGYKAGISRLYQELVEVIAQRSSRTGDWNPPVGGGRRAHVVVRRSHEHSNVDGLGSGGL